MKIIKDNKSNAEYKVTSSRKNAAGKSVAATVEYKASKNKNVKKITIPDTIKVGGVVYKVTAISNGAFKGNKKVKVK